MPSKNHGRMAQDMKRELIAIIGEMKDPRITGGLLTVTRLDVTPDLDVAKGYISVLGREGGADPVVKLFVGFCTGLIAALVCSPLFGGLVLPPPAAWPAKPPIAPPARPPAILFDVEWLP